MVEKPPQKSRMLLAYQGTDWSGWQVQPNGPSIQATLEQVLSQILQEPIHVVGSGRTDAGVHAIGQVAHFRHLFSIDPSRLILSANALLPPSIRIRAIESAESFFHAQRSATKKIYHYLIGEWPSKVPFVSPFRWSIGYQIEEERLQQAASLFVGTHDFTSFANEAHKGAAAVDAVRRIDRIDWVREPFGGRLEFEGEGFLYKMVRNIVGTLIEVARGKRECHEIPLLLAAKDRRRVGVAAPPEGLVLIHVGYQGFSCFQSLEPDQAIDWGIQWSCHSLHHRQ